MRRLIVAPFAKGIFHLRSFCFPSSPIPFFFFSSELCMSWSFDNTTHTCLIFSDATQASTFVKRTNSVAACSSRGYRELGSFCLAQRTLPPRFQNSVASGTLFSSSTTMSCEECSRSCDRNATCQAWTCASAVCSQYSLLDSFHPSDSAGPLSACSQRMVDLKCFRMPCQYGFIGDLCEVELLRNSTDIFVDGGASIFVPAPTVTLCAKMCSL